MARENLQITITAVDKATGTFKGLADTIGSVQKQADGLKDVQKNLNWMFLGQDLMRAAKTGVTGLMSLAKASSDVVEAQNFVQQVFGDSTDAVIQFSKTATKSTLMSEKAILDASATFGLFGKAAGLAGDDLTGFSTNLVQLAADMASIKNTTVDQAINAIGAAFRGQSRPIRQYGVLIDAATVKQQAFEMGIYNGNGALTQAQRVIATNQILFEQLGFAVGDVNRTFDTMANQQRYLSASFENFKAHVGTALVPMFTGIMDAANKMLGVFESLPQPVQNLATRIGAVGVAAVGLGGSFIYVAAKVGQGIQAFNDMRSSMNAWVASGGKARSTMAAIGKAGAGLAAAAAGAQLVFSTLNDVQDVAGKTTKAIQEMNIALAKGQKQEAWSGFLDLAKQKDDALTFGHLITDVGKKIQLLGSDAKRPIEDLDAAFKELMNQNPANAAAMLQIMREQIEAGDQNSKQVQDNISLYNRWDAELKRNVQSMQASGEATGLTQEQLDEFGDSALDAGEATDEMQKGLDEATQQMQEWADAINKVDSAMMPLADKTEAFGDAADQALGNTEWVDNLIEGKDAVAQLVEKLKDSDAAVRSGAEALDINTESGRENLKTVGDLADLVGQDMARAFKESGGNVEEARKTMLGWRDSIADQMRQAGISEPVIQSYLEKLNLTDQTFESIIKLSGQEEARRKLDELNISYQELPPAIYTKVQALIDAGDYQGAYETMKNFLTQPVETPVDTTGEADAAHDAKNTIDGIMSSPVDQPVKSEDRNSGAVKNALRSFFANNVEQPVNTENYNRFATKGGLTSFFGSAIAQMIDTANNDRSGTKSTIKGTFDSPVNQEIKTYNNDAHSTKSSIASVFAGAISQVVRTVNNIVNNVVDVITPGMASYGAAPPTAAEYAATSMARVGGTAYTGAGSVPGRVRAGGYAPQSTPSIVNLNVNLPIGTSETKVVELLKNYQRNNGRGRLAS